MLALELAEAAAGIVAYACTCLSADHALRSEDVLLLEAEWHLPSPFEVHCSL